MILNGFAPDSIAVALARLRAGGLLGLPTETVYGLAADAENAAAVAHIFQAKGRPADHPLIVHVLDAGGVAHFAEQVPEFAHALIAAFWPGPLTLILPRRAGVATTAAGGHASIGLRSPSHPVARALLAAGLETGTDGAKPVWGVAAPSANQFGRVSPTTAAHVQSEFEADLLILDGGACAVGIESTIIDCTRGAPVLLRPGAITAQQAQAACGQRVLSKEELESQSAPTPKASGTLESHYAPHAKVCLMDALALQTALKVRAPQAPLIAVYARNVPDHAAAPMLLRRMPDDAPATAHQLFAVLRELDDQGVSHIWIETPPNTPDWDGVRDRLQRAAAG